MLLHRIGTLEKSPEPKNVVFGASISVSQPVVHVIKAIETVKAGSHYAENLLRSVIVTCISAEILEISREPWSSGYGRRLMY